jgi:hypothetical protein
MSGFQVDRFTAFLGGVPFRQLLAKAVSFLYILPFPGISPKVRLFLIL